MTQKNLSIEVQKFYNSGERNFSKQQLRRINLKNAQLKKINLEGADLSYADLRDADLSGANLRACYLNEANMSGADLTGADLTGAYIIKAYLTKTNLQKAILKEAYLTGSFLTRANLVSTDITGTYFNSTHLSGATFLDACYDRTTRFDQGIIPEKLGMVQVSSFTSTVARKITIAQMMASLEQVAAITIHYLGGTITVRNFEQTRPDIDWLDNFTMNKKGNIDYQGSINSKATTLQLKWLEKWTYSFIDKSAEIIHDLPIIIEDKKLLM